MAVRILTLLCLLFAGCLLFETVQAQGDGEEAETTSVEAETSSDASPSSPDGSSTDGSSSSPSASSTEAAPRPTTQPPPEGCPRLAYGSCQEKCETDADCLKNNLRNRKCCPCQRISIPFLVPPQNVTNSCVAVPPPQ